MKNAMDIMQMVLRKSEQPLSYYGEIDVKTYGDQHLIEHQKSEVYSSFDGKRKVISYDLLTKKETISLNDGKKLVVYEKGRSEATVIDIDDSSIADFVQPIDQLKMIFQMVEDSFIYMFVGEEKIFDFTTYHIRLLAKEKNDLFDEVDIWVEQETAFLIKMISSVDNLRVELQYTKLEFSPHFQDDVFKMNLPNSIKMVSLDEQFTPKNCSLHEAEQVLGQSFLIVSNDNNTQMHTIQILDLKKQFDRDEVEVNYVSQKGDPLFTISIFKIPKGLGMAIKKGKRQIRGLNAEYDKFVKSVTWDEDGLRYTLIIQDKKLSFEEVTALVEKMEFSSNKTNKE